MKNGNRVLMSLVVSLIAAFTTAAPASAQGPATDIKVHGHWAIDVRNPDGSLASHNEFENALQGGNIFLAAILGKEMTVTGWNIYVNAGIGVPGGPCNFQGAPGPCFIQSPPGTSNGTDATFYTLTIQPLKDANGSYTGVLQLAGNFTAAFAGSVGAVGTDLSTNTLSGGFSARTLQTPISVAAGQQVYVTVTFSFS